MDAYGSVCNHMDQYQELEWDVPSPLGLWWSDEAPELFAKPIDTFQAIEGPLSSPGSKDIPETLFAVIP